MWAPAFTGRQANWPQDAAMIQKWGVDVNARINRVMTALFGPDMAVPEKIEPKYSRVEKEEERRFGGW